MEHRNDLQSHAFSGLGKDLWQNTEFYLNEQVDKNPERYPHFSGKLP